MSSIEQYGEIVGEEAIDHLRQLARPLRGIKIVHVNSTRTGGGVAEILTQLVPLMGELGLDARWEVIQGEESFFQCTKSFHNALQGNALPLSDAMFRSFEETNANSRRSCEGSSRKPTLSSSTIRSLSLCCGYARPAKGNGFGDVTSI